MACGYHARTGEPAEVDRLLQRDVEEQATGLHEQPEIAHGREAGAQRAARVGDGAQRAQRRVVLYGVQRALVIRPAQ